MNKSVHGLLQVLGVALQLVNISAVPSKYQPVAIAAVALGQAIMAYLNHPSEVSSGSK